MSLEDEDNSPFREPVAIREDEFTDLPLGDDDDDQQKQEEEEDEEKRSTTTTIDKSETQQESVERSTDHQQETVTEYDPVPHSTGTVAYNPEIYTPTLQQHSFKDKSAVNAEIIAAGKSHEGQSRGYIVYTIRCNDQIVRRRYSEFESLRSSLVKLFPTLIIPPIPEKHHLTNYATAPTKAKEDTAIIEHRRRMLTVFLKRCLEIDQVRESSVYQSFLDPNSNWSEVLTSPPLSDIPKNPLRANPMDPAHSTAAHSYLPIPSSAVMLVKDSEEDRKFNRVEEKAKEYEEVIAGGIDKVNKRLVRHLADTGNEFSEAAAAFNAFSLQETDDIAQSLEKIGHVNDNCYLSTETLVNTLNYEFTEPLGESVQFASVVKDLVKFRQQKSLQLDITARSLKHRMNYLKLLEKSEQESKRIENALEAGEGRTGQINFNRKVAKQQEEQKLTQELSQTDSTDSTTPLEPKKSSVFKIPGISKITTMIKETIESDPDTVRLNNLNKAKEDINQLRQTYTAAQGDLAELTSSITSQLEKFHETKNEELKKMILAYTSAVLDWCRKNQEFWEEARTAISAE